MSFNLYAKHKAVTAKCLYHFGSPHKKLKFSIKNFFSKCDQIRNSLRIWSHLLKKSLMGNFIFCAVDNVSRIGGFVSII